MEEESPSINIIIVEVRFRFDRWHCRVRLQHELVQAAKAAVHRSFSTKGQQPDKKLADSTELENNAIIILRCPIHAFGSMLHNFNQMQYFSNAKCLVHAGCPAFLLIYAWTNWRIYIQDWVPGLLAPIMRGVSAVLQGGTYKIRLQLGLKQYESIMFKFHCYMLNALLHIILWSCVLFLFTVNVICSWKAVP